MLDPSEYTVGWVCGNPMDFSAAYTFLDKEHADTGHNSHGDMSTYSLGQIGGHNVVITTPPQMSGRVRAAATLGMMRQRFPNIRIVLSVGIAGGSPSLGHDIRLGDVVVGRPGDGPGGVCDYDDRRVISAPERTWTGPLRHPPKILLEATRLLEAQHKISGHRLASVVEAALQKVDTSRFGRPAPTHDRLYRSDYLHSTKAGSCDGVCDTAYLVDRDERDEGKDEPVIHYGVIANGDTIMKNAQSRDKIALEKGVLCFDIDAVDLMDPFPCLVIRGICNYADSHGNRDWQGYAAIAAAAYATDLLRVLPSFRNMTEKSMLSVLESSQSHIPDGEAQISARDPFSRTTRHPRVETTGFQNAIQEDDYSSSDGSTASSDFSHASSTSSSLGGYEGFRLREQLATFLLRDEEMRSFYERALSLCGIESFSKKHSGLLKKYVADLKGQKKTNLHRQAVRLLGGVKERGEVTNWVVQSMIPAYHSLDKLKQQSAAGDRKIVKQLPHLLGTQISETRPAPQGARYETESEDSGAAEDLVMEDANDGGPRVFENLVEGAAFEAYKARMSCLVNPSLTIDEALSAHGPDLLAALLEQRFSKVATDEYGWIKDLRDARLRRREIAEVLYSSAHDKPWIVYAPDSGLVDKWKSTRTDFHSEACSHSLLSQASKNDSSVSITESVNDLPHVQYTELQRHIEELCGLGGITSNTRHQTAWNGRVQFGQNCAAAISYSFDDPEHPELDTPLQIAHRLHKMSVSLLAAMALLQETRSCCNLFTVLNLVEEPTEHRRRLQLCKISFHWATVFEHCCQKTVESLTRQEEATPDLMLLGAWSASLLSKLHLSDVVPMSQDSAFSAKTHLHVASVTMQLLCVGLLSYAQAHVGSLNPFFLDCRIDEILLLGLHTTSHANENRQLHVKSHLVSLSCLGEMTRDKVMIFSLSDRSANLDAEWQFDIFGAPEDIMDTWGPGQMICRQDSHNTPVAMVLADGFIGPVRSDNGAVTYHWDHQLNMPPDAPDLNMKEMITVGTFVKVNQQCCSQGQMSLRWEQTANCLFELGTGYSFWETVEQQRGLQAGYQVIGQANWTKAKRPGTSIKQVRLQQLIDDVDLIDFLGSPWAVQVSHCTGVSQRVLLRHLAGELLPIFAQAETNANHIQNWNLLKDRHKVFENLRNDRGAGMFRSWLVDLPPTLRDFLLRMIRVLLPKVANTGLSPDRRFFSIAWISPDSLSSCIRIPLEHDHAKWLQMLEDSGECATFAYMSDTCLEAGGIKCQGSGWRWKHQIPMLETAVHCPEQQHNQWTLTHGQVYFFRHLNRDLFWVKAETNASNTRLPATTTRLVRSNNVPAHIANRVAERFREKKDRRICEKRLITTWNSPVAVVVSSR